MIETLYFKCYNAFLLKNLEETKMFFGLLKEELKNVKKDYKLPVEYLKELRGIRDAIRSGSFSSQSWVDADVPLKIAKSTGERFPGRQDDLVKKIHYESADQLRGILSESSTFHLYNLEHPCGTHGAVDMVYADDTTHYPVEVKKDEGMHDIISQISKYDLAFKLRMNLKFYKKVQPVTICASYQNNVVKELKALGVKVILYKLLNDKVKLTEI